MLKWTTHTHTHNYTYVQGTSSSSIYSAVVFAAGINAQEARAHVRTSPRYLFDVRQRFIHV
jgi:hypothetical protein